MTGIDKTRSAPSPQYVPNAELADPASQARGRSLPSSELQARASSGSPPPRRSISPSASARVAVQANEVSELLNQGGLAFLQQGAKTNFDAVPPEFRALPQQMARLLGITTEPAPAAKAVSFAVLSQRLDATTAAANELAKFSKLDLASALTQEPQHRAAAMQPYIELIRDSSRATADAFRQMPVAELRANRDAVKEELPKWVSATEQVHEQLKAQLGELHPVTVAALEARTEASSAYGKTMMRMAVANLGNKAYELTVGPVINRLTGLFGGGSNSA